MATAEPGPYTKITRESLNMKKEEKKLLGNQNNNHNKNGKNEAWGNEQLQNRVEKELSPGFSKVIFLKLNKCLLIWKKFW